MKIIQPVLPVSIAKNLQILRMIYFTCSDKCISHNNGQGIFGRCKMDCVEERLIERSKCYESEKRYRLFEGSCRNASVGLS